MENIDNKTVAEIVTENIKAADIFKKNKIDFCCGGNVPVQEVCAKKGVDYSKLKEEILNIGKAPTGAQDFNTWDIDFLADYIVNTHHKYVVEANHLIIQYSDRIEIKEFSEFHRWIYQGGKSLFGLLKRREAEHQLFKKK